MAWSKQLKNVRGKREFLKHKVNLSTKSICHEIKSSIRWYKGYCPIIFKSGQTHTPNAKVDIYFNNFAAKIAI
jgi:hypothetical protein